MRNESIQQRRARASARPRRIVLAEDEPDIRDLLKELLETGLESVEVDARPDAGAALRAIAARTPDLIITDFRMPGMDGLTLLAHARIRAPGVPGILITAYPDVEIAMRAINEARVQSFLPKPIEPEKLLQTVGGIFAAQQQHQERLQELPGNIRAVESLRTTRYY